jgi:hypothetical protein
MIGCKNNQKGLAQIPIMIGLLVMAVALPLATKLIKENQDNRNLAAPVFVNRCYCIDRNCTKNCNWSTGGGLFDCTEKGSCGILTPTPAIRLPTGQVVNVCARVICPRGQSCVVSPIGNTPICISTTSMPTPTPMSVIYCSGDYNCSTGWSCKPLLPESPNGIKVCLPTSFTPTPGVGCTGVVCPTGQVCVTGLGMALCAPAVTPTAAASGCFANSDCGAGKICVKPNLNIPGICVTVTPTPTNVVVVMPTAACGSLGGLNTYGCGGRVLSGQPAYYGCINSVNLEQQIAAGGMNCPSNKLTKLERNADCSCSLKCADDQGCELGYCYPGGNLNTYGCNGLVTSGHPSTYGCTNASDLQARIAAGTLKCSGNKLAVLNRKPACDCQLICVDDVTCQPPTSTPVPPTPTVRTCSAGFVNTYGCKGTISSSAWNGASCKNGYPANPSCPNGTLTKLKRNTDCSCEVVCESMSSCNSCSSAVFKYGCGASLTPAIFTSKGCSNSGSVVCPWYKKAVLTRTTSCVCTTSCVSDTICQ